MPRGIYTQTVCILLRQPTVREELRPALESYTIRREIADESDWPFGGPAFIVDYRPEVNGFVSVDVVNQPWPDHMGDPKNETMLFSAWAMGMFGAETFPGCLQRAMQQSWAWPEGKTLPAEHTGFIRIRTSYAFGAEEDVPLYPNDYDAEQDLEFITGIARALLRLPQAMCFFNPNGEVLRDRPMVEENLEFGRDHELPPLELWSNVRLFQLDGNWVLMDTVGNEQLDIPDFEAAFDRKYDCGEVDGFLRNLTLYLLDNGEVIEDQNTVDGPGGIRWRAHFVDDALSVPPRRVICFLPQDDAPVPDLVLNRPQRD